MSRFKVCDDVSIGNRWCRTSPHVLIPFGREPIIFDPLLFVREACQIRGLEVGGPCLTERGLGVETHFVLGFVVSCACGGRIASFFWGVAK